MDDDPLKLAVEWRRARLCLQAWTGIRSGARPWWKPNWRTWTMTHSQLEATRNRVAASANAQPRTLFPHDFEARRQQRTSIRPPLPQQFGWYELSPPLTFPRAAVRTSDVSFRAVVWEQAPSWWALAGADQLRAGPRNRLQL